MRMDSTETTLYNWQDKLIGRYQLNNLLGRSATSEVWQASDIHLGRQVAIKLLPPVLASNREYLEIFTQEARAAATLDHPNILAIHDFGEQAIKEGEIIPYLVMPYVSGGTLHTRMSAVKGGMLPVEESLHYLKQGAQAIDYAHSQQVLHRDIKPSNLLLQRVWLLLADFGVAKILKDASEHTTLSWSGTPEYMAPEMIEGHAEPASDRYSLAVIAYQLFTGHLPFRGDTPSDTLTLQLTEAPPSPRKFNQQLPPEVESVLLQGLAKRPGERPGSCTLFVDALTYSWLNKTTTSRDPNLTLLAPWSKRWQESAPISTHFSEPDPYSDDARALENSATELDVPPMTPAREGAPETPVLPLDTRTLPPARLSGGEATEFMPLQEDGAKSEKTLNRRKLLIGGSVAAAAVVASGAIAAPFVYNRLGGLLRPSPTPTPKPVLGPRNLIPAVPLLSLDGHEGEVWVTKWHPKGRYLVTASEDARVLLWDIETALKNNSSPTKLTKPMRSWNIAGIKFDNSLDGLCWSSDGQKLIAGTDFKDKAYVVEAFADTNIPTVYNDSLTTNLDAYTSYESVCPGPTPNHFTVSGGNFLHIFRFGKTDQAEQILYCDKEKVGRILSLTWAPDRKTLVAMTDSAGSSNTLQLARWPPNQQRANLIELQDRGGFLTFFRMADTIAWSPADPNILLVSNADVASVIDFKGNKIILGIGIVEKLTEDSRPELSGLSWSPNGRYIAGSYSPPGDRVGKMKYKPGIHIWDLTKLHRRVNPDNSVEIQRPTLTFEQQGPLQHDMAILDVKWSPDGRYLATPSLDGQVLIWKVDAG